MQYAAPAYVHTKSREAAMLYAQLLNATGRLPEARLILEKAVSAGQASVGMKALLQEIYTRTGETRTIAISTDSNLVKKVRAEMVHEPVSTITLKDISGKPVSLSALKGKIVVLDFWATWCKPCIASFPAMQQVMRQHPDVVFLFIATFEKGNALQNVQRFAKENAYLFRYVMDEPLTGDIFKGYTHFKVTGVPYKLVIDKEGFIRFRSGGFAGNDDVLINELNAVIAALR